VNGNDGQNNFYLFSPLGGFASSEELEELLLIFFNRPALAVHE
jgi:hypothetical protein